MPFRFDETDVTFAAFRDKAAAAVRSLCLEGYELFISGMARGCDMLFAELVLALKTEFPGIQLLCALPFEGQTSGWGRDSVAQYRSILLKADRTVTVGEGHPAAAYMARNRFMCDHADTVLAVYDGQPGGTCYTVHYAKKHGKRVIMMGTDGIVFEQTEFSV